MQWQSIWVGMLQLAVKTVKRTPLVSSRGKDASQQHNEEREQFLGRVPVNQMKDREVFFWFCHHQYHRGVYPITNARVEFGRKFQMKDASEQSAHKKRSEVGDLLIIHYAEKGNVRRRMPIFCAITLLKN